MPKQSTIDHRFPENVVSLSFRIYSIQTFAVHESVEAGIVRYKLPGPVMDIICAVIRWKTNGTEIWQVSYPDDSDSTRMKMALMIKRWEDFRLFPPNGLMHRIDQP